MVTGTNGKETREVHWVGIDVSKRSFDAALVRTGQKWPATPLREIPVRDFERNLEGVKSFLGWICGLTGDEQVRVVMEATGKYSTELAEWLLARQASIEPAIVNPHYTAAFMKSFGLRNKTDRLEARALGFYGIEREPAPYEPPTAEIAELRALNRYRDTLVRQKVAIGNRAGEGSAAKLVRQMQKRVLRQLKRDIKRIEEEMKTIVHRTPYLEKDVELLCSIYGVGFIVAAVIIAELGDLRRFRKARQLTAFAGLSPRIYQSGTSVSRQPRMCKKGNPRVRQALYLSAMVAVQGQNDMQRTYRRLVEQGKPKMAALGAIMRKQLTVMRAILISGQPYNPEWKLSGEPQRI